MQMTGPILKKVYQGLERLGAESGSQLLGKVGRGLSSGIEEGTEEIIQGSIIQATEQTYNNYFAPEDAEFGKGKFRVGSFDTSQLLQEGGLGFMGAGAHTIMGGAHMTQDQMDTEGDI